MYDTYGNEKRSGLPGKDEPLPHMVREYPSLDYIIAYTSLFFKGKLSIKELSEEKIMNEMNKELQFLNTKDIAALMGVSLPVARQIMHRKDFPLIKAGKNLKVMRKNFEEWASERRM